MPGIKSAAAGIAIKEKLANADHSDLKTSSFWISQIFMIIATVAGVYLAAQAGLQQAIEFDNLTSTESNYYLRQSLYDEVDANVSLLRTYNKEFFSRPLQKNELEKNTPALRRFVWESMKYSPSTLETPSYFLREIQGFYADIDLIMANRLSWAHGPSYASKLMTEQLDHIENVVLPKLADNTRQLAQELKDAGMDVEDSVAYEETAAANAADTAKAQ